jgi:hypothetical protein
MNNKYLLYIIIAISSLVIINSANTSIFLFIAVILIATVYDIYVAITAHKKTPGYTSLFVVLGISGLMLIVMRLLDEFFMLGGLNEDYLIVRQFMSIISLTLPAIILIKFFIKENFLVKK